MKKQRTDSITKRTIVIGCFFCMLFITFGVKAAYLQIFQGAWLSSAAEKQMKKSVITREKRGIIYDAKHREMAVGIDVMSIAAFPQRIKDIDTTAIVLSQALNLNGSALIGQLLSDKHFIWIKRQVMPREMQSVKNLRLEGVSFITERSRFYPNKTLAAQLIGFTGVDGNGLEGLEYYFDSYLRGAAGKHTVLKDALGRGFDPAGNDTQETSGYHLVLTIDQTIQYIVEKELEEGVRKFSAKSGMAVVMAPRTGMVLALANYPYFNPNSFNDFDKQQWRNRVITDPFEPGSTLKIFTVAAALESGTALPETIFFTEGGEYRVGKKVIHDTHPHDVLSLADIVKYSSNIGAVKISEAIGPEVLYDTLVQFGFGAKTGIDCPGETNGVLLPLRRWSQMDASAIAFGQGISVSAIQLITALSAVANDGTLMRPYTVQAILDPNGGLIERYRPQKVRRIISAESARMINRMLRSVVEADGTGVLAALDGYSICGKTGTAQKADPNGGYAEGAFVASFMGFAPAEKPEIAILVVIDEPQEQYYGGVVAAPIFKNITLKTLDCLNIPPRREAGRLTVSLETGVSG